VKIWLLVGNQPDAMNDSRNTFGIYATYMVIITRCRLVPSGITLDSDDMEGLRRPSIFERFKTHALYSTLSEELSKKRVSDPLTSVGKKRLKI